MPPADFTNPNAGETAAVTPPAVLDQLVQAVCDAVSPAELLVASDFDGTLSPIVAMPGAARPLPASLAVLRRLQELGANVAIVSGRSVDALRRAVPVDGVRLLGDYGLEAPNEEEREALRAFNARVLEEFTGVEGVVVEPKPGSTSVHFRDNPAAGPDVVAKLAPLAESLGLRAGEGRMVVEVRPAAADKGVALTRLLAELRPRAIVFGGDDEGDRSAFQAAATSGLRHLVVGVRSEEVAPDLFDQCDAVIGGPPQWAAILERVAARLSS
jgi:trehalose 6-phosphate phosphatase